MKYEWKEALRQQLNTPHFHAIERTIADDRRIHDVFPPDNELFHCLSFASPHETKVVIIGQDPYHGEGQAHGLSFSVPQGIPIPPSLRNILKELTDDCNIPASRNGDLTGWAEQGVLLLNTTLSVRSGQPGSHVGCGWEAITDRIIEVVNENSECCVFILWGAHARKKRAIITAPHHVVIEGVHPSPLAAYRGFFGSKPFSRTNQALADAGRTPIDWTLQ